MKKRTIKEMQAELDAQEARMKFLKATVGKLGKWHSEKSGNTFLTVKLKGVKSIMLNVDAYNELVELIDSEIIKQAIEEYDIN